MRPSGLLCAVATASLLAAVFPIVVPQSPGAYVLVVTLASIGLGVLYGRPSPAVLQWPWRRARRLRRAARLLGTPWLARGLSRIGWNRAVRAPLRSPADLPERRRQSTGALLSHGVSALIHLAAGAALATLGHLSAAAAIVLLGTLLHAWPALLQIDVLGRLDALEDRLRASSDPEPS